MLKQSAFFKRIKRKNLTVPEYTLLHKLYHKPSLSAIAINIILNKYKGIHGYINTDCTLNEKGVKLIENMEVIFKPQKQLNAIDVLGDDCDERIKEYINIFPSGKLPTGKYARGNKKEIQENFKWFFQEYHYDWDVIIGATEMYVEEYRRKNYEYMRTAMYFIRKLREGLFESDLATYCDAYLTGDDRAKVVHKRRVV